MKKLLFDSYNKLILVLFLLLPTLAQAADNAVILTPGTGVTMRSIDIGAGVQSSGVNLVGSTGASILGTAGTANANVITMQGISGGTPITETNSAAILAAIGNPIATQAGTVSVGGVSLLGINAAATLAGNGVTGTGSLRVTVASDNTPYAIKIDQTTSGTTNAIRTIAGATGGGTISSVIAPATPAGVNLKASAGSVFRVFATTIQATPVYIKLYNASSAPTCGSGTPVARFMVPVASTAANGAGTNIDIGDIGAAFGTGIGYCVTGALADNDTTAITANNTLVNIVWN